MKNIYGYESRKSVRNFFSKISKADVSSERGFTKDARRALKAEGVNPDKRKWNQKDVRQAEKILKKTGHLKRGLGERSLRTKERTFFRRSGSTTQAQSQGQAVKQTGGKIVSIDNLRKMNVKELEELKKSEKSLDQKRDIEKIISAKQPSQVAKNEVDSLTSYEISKIHNVKELEGMLKTTNSLDTARDVKNRINELEGGDDPTRSQISNMNMKELKSLKTSLEKKVQANKGGVDALGLVDKRIEFLVTARNIDGNRDLNDTKTDRQIIDDILHDGSGSQPNTKESDMIDIKTGKKMRKPVNDTPGLSLEQINIIRGKEDMPDIPDLEI
ncbi:hypothetical protein KKA15_06020 [Patescibacteria group bacterium]|nr:hypothetical protein [Patescibacteria group bacterium]